MSSHDHEQVDPDVATTANSDPIEDPTVTVIVPVKDGLELLRSCVGALVAQTYPADRLRILVVDNGSSRSPSTVLPDDPRVQLLTEPVAGSYRARNTALEHADGEIVAFTDADCLPSPTWIRCAVDYLVAHPEVDMIGGRVDITFSAGRPVNGPEWYEFVEGFPQKAYVASGFAVTANMVTRRSVFERVGVFDASLLSGGDSEWGRRVRAAGGRQDYVDTADVAHPARDTWAELTTKARRTTGGVVAKARTGPRPVLRLIRILVAPIANSARSVVTVWRRPGLSGFPARLHYLGARLRVNAAVAGVVLRELAATIRPGRS